MLAFLVIFTIIIIYLSIQHLYSYWSRNAMPDIDPSIPFGNLSRIISRKVSFGVGIYELYKQATLPFIGIYFFFRPAILVRNAGLTKRILTTDFKYFHDRGVYHSDNDPMSENLFAMTGQKWRNLRAKLTPTFTSGKLKEMLPTILAQGDKLQIFMENKAQNSNILEMKEMMSRYTLNVIGTTIFGLEVDTINNPNDSFFNIDKIIISKDFTNLIRSIGIFLCPKLLEYLRIPSTSPEIRSYMVNIVKQQIEYREKNNIFRKDFIQSLIELRKTGKINDDTLSTTAETSSSLTSSSVTTKTIEESIGNELNSMPIEQCAAQIFLFYVAGFDTSASTMTFCLFELSRNPELMQKLQNEIDETIQKYNNELTYECIQDMKLLELCFKETIRKYPAVPILTRECTEDYPVPDTHTIIKKGTSIIISLLGIGRDPNNFPEPILFRPERFSDPIPQYKEEAFIPFGDGPRACIASQFGKLMTKIGLIKLLRKYNFTPINENELEFDNYGIALVVKDGVNLKITNR